MDTDGLPGAEVVNAGLRDLASGSVTVESLLVSIGAPKLRSLGFDVPPEIAQPELKLYLRLRDEYGDAAHSRYNSLVRRLVSFERAASCAN